MEAETYRQYVEHAILPTTQLRIKFRRKNRLLFLRSPELDCKVLYINTLLIYYIIQCEKYGLEAVDVAIPDKWLRYRVKAVFEDDESGWSAWKYYKIPDDQQW